jgi:N-acetylneuraminic acid mutarotase
MQMTSRILNVAALAALTLAAIACGGDDDPSPTATPAEPAGTATPSATATTVENDSGPPAAKGWRTLAPMPTPRSEVAAAELNGEIYVIGGFERDGSSSNKVEAYNPETDSWRQIGPLPEPRHHAAAFVFGSLFVMGGFEAGFDDPQTSVFQYNASTDTWAEATTLPEPRGGHAAAVIQCGEDVLGACIFAVGGTDADRTNIAAVAVNDPSGLWLRAADLPTPRDHLAVGAVDENIYAIGGRVNVDFGQNLDANEEYDPETDTWTARAPLPTARSGIAGVVLGGHIYIFGGEGSEGTFDENEAYDPQTDTWETLEPMPTARHGLGAAVVGDTIYVIGGGETPGLSVSGANEAFTP